MDLLLRLFGICTVFVICIAVGVEGVLYGEACTGPGTGDCTETVNIVCDTTCKCTTDSFRKDDTECATRILLNAACTASQPMDQCADTLAECSSGLTCVCKSGNFEKNDGVCAAQIALTQSCATGQPADQCADTNAECVGTPLTCSCKTAHFVNKDGACDPSVGLDGTCDGTDMATDQCRVADTKCRDDGAGSKCLCITTHFSDGVACKTKIAGIGTTCNGTVVDKNQCSVADTECRNDDAGSQCLCKATHYSDGTVCQTRKYPDATCGGDECVINASCVETKCTCDADYTPSPTVSPTMCNGVVKITSLTHLYVVPFLVSLMFLLR